MSDFVTPGKQSANRRGSSAGGTRALRDLSSPLQPPGVSTGSVLLTGGMSGGGRRILRSALELLADHQGTPSPTTSRRDASTDDGSPVVRKRLDGTDASWPMGSTAPNTSSRSTQNRPRGYTVTDTKVNLRTVVDRKLGPASDAGHYRPETVSPAAGMSSGGSPPQKVADYAETEEPSALLFLSTPDRPPNLRVDRNAASVRSQLNSIDGGSVVVNAESRLRCRGAEGVTLQVGGAQREIAAATSDGSSPVQRVVTAHGPPSSDVDTLQSEPLFSETEVRCRIASALEEYERARDEEESRVLQEAGEEIEAQNKRYTDLQATLKAAMDEGTKMGQQVEALTSQCEQLQQTTETLYKELLQEQERARRLDVAVCHAEDEKRRTVLEVRRELEFERSQHQLSREEDARRLKTLQGKCDDFVSQAAALEEAQRVAKRQLLDLQSELADAQRDIEEGRKARQYTEAELKTLTEQLRDKSSAAERAEKALLEAEKQLKADSSQRRGEMNQLVKKNAELEQDLQRQTDEVRRKMARLSQAELESARRAEENAELRRQLDGLVGQQTTVATMAEALLENIRRGMATFAARTTPPDVASESAPLRGVRGALGSPPSTRCRSAASVMAALSPKPVDRTSTFVGSPLSGAADADDISHGDDEGVNSLTDADDAVDVDTNGNEGEGMFSSGAHGWILGASEPLLPVLDGLPRYVSYFSSTPSKSRRVAPVSPVSASSGVAKRGASRTPSPGISAARRAQLTATATVRVLQQVDVAFVKYHRRCLVAVRRASRSLEPAQQRKDADEAQMKEELRKAIGVAVAAAEAKATERLLTLQQKLSHSQEKLSKVRSELNAQRGAYEASLERLLNDDAHQQAARKALEELEHTQAQLRAQRDELREARAQRSRLEQEQDGLRQELGVARGLLQATQTEGAQLQLQVRELERELEERDGRLSEAREAMAREARQCEEGAATRERLQARVAKLSESLRLAEARVEERQADLAALQVRNRALESNLRAARGAASRAAAAASAGAVTQRSSGRPGTQRDGGAEQGLESAKKELSSLRESHSALQALAASAEVKEAEWKRERAALTSQNQALEREVAEAVHAMSLRGVVEEATLCAIVDKLNDALGVGVDAVGGPKEAVTAGGTTPPSVSYHSAESPAARKPAAAKESRERAMETLRHRAVALAQRAALQLSAAVPRAAGPGRICGGRSHSPHQQGFSGADDSYLMAEVLACESAVRSELRRHNGVTTRAEATAAPAYDSANFAVERLCFDAAEATTIASGTDYPRRTTRSQPLLSKPRGGAARASSTQPSCSAGKVEVTERWATGIGSRLQPPTVSQPHGLHVAPLQFFPEPQEAERSPVVLQRSKSCFSSSPGVSRSRTRHSAGESFSGQRGSVLAPDNRLNRSGSIEVRCLDGASQSPPRPPSLRQNAPLVAESTF